MGQKGDKKQGVYSIHAGCEALYGSRSRSQNPNKNISTTAAYLYSSPNLLKAAVELA
jgi:hypothetical protein